jgi:hypothetical protein
MLPDRLAAAILRAPSDLLHRSLRIRTMAASRPAGSGPPPDRVTRGKTARNRLRGSDHFLLHYDRSLLTRRDGRYARALCVDLGYGATPHTTLEWRRRLATCRTDLAVLGVEVDPDRVDRARPYREPGTDFRLGGFDLPLAGDEHVRMIRAFNVLRQYAEHEALPAWDTLAAQLLPGGLLVDGTSDPLGRVWTACLLRRPDDGSVSGETGAGGETGATDASVPWTLEGLVLGVNLRIGFDVEALQTRLPKAFIHRVVPGEPVHTLFEDLKLAAAATRSLAVWGPRQWFAAATAYLAGQGHDVVLHSRWLKQGWLVWRRPPVPGRRDHQDLGTSIDSDADCL